jgi:hypothetical protein
MAARYRYKPHPSWFGECMIAKEGLEKGFDADYDLNADDQYRIEDGDRVFCMHLATPSQKRESTLDDFLILRRKPGMIGTFERIGLMPLQIDFDGKDFYRMFESRREECAITIV